MGYTLPQLIRAIFNPENGLTSSERLVAACLARHADDAGNCYPSIMLISRECALSERTVRYTLKSLAKKRWVQVQRQDGKTNIYSLSIPDGTHATNSPLQQLHHGNDCRGATDAPHPGNDCTTPRQQLQGSPANIAGVTPEPRQSLHPTPAMIAAKLPNEEINNAAAADIYKTSHTVEDPQEQQHQQQENIVTAFERCFGRFPSSYQLEVFESYIQDGLEERLVILAMEKAAMDGKGPRYAQGILQDWLAKGIRTVEQAEREEREWRERQKVVPLNRPQQKQQKQDLDWTPPYWREYVPKEEPKPKFDILKLDVDKLPLLNAKQRAHLKKLQEEERKRRAAMKDATNGSA